MHESQPPAEAPGRGGSPVAGPASPAGESIAPAGRTRRRPRPDRWGTGGSGTVGTVRAPARRDRTTPAAAVRTRGTAAVAGPLGSPSRARSTHEDEARRAGTSMPRSSKGAEPTGAGAATGARTWNARESSPPNGEGFEGAPRSGRRREGRGIRDEPSRSAPGRSPARRARSPRGSRSRPSSIRRTRGSGPAIPRTPRRTRDTCIPPGRDLFP